MANGDDVLQRIGPLIGFLTSAIGGGRAGAAGFAQGLQQQQQQQQQLLIDQQRQQLLKAQAQEVQARLQERIQRHMDAERAQVEEAWRELVRQTQGAVNSADSLREADELLEDAARMAARLGKGRKDIEDRIFLPEETLKAKADASDLKGLAEKVRAIESSPVAQGQDLGEFTINWKGEDITLNQARRILNLPEFVGTDGHRATYAEAFPSVFASPNRVARDFADRPAPVDKDGNLNVGQALEDLKKAGAIQSESESRVANNEAVKRWRERLVEAVRQGGQGIDLGEIRKGLTRAGAVQTESDWRAELSSATQKVTEDLVGLAGGLQRLSPQPSQLERLIGRSQGVELEDATGVERQREIQEAVEFAREFTPPVQATPENSAVARQPVIADDSGLPQDAGKFVLRSELRAMAEAEGISMAEAEAEARASQFIIIEDER